MKKLIIALLLIPSIAFADSGSWKHITNKLSFAAIVITVDKVIKSIKNESEEK